jgi:PAS domain S-box-containing protein
MTEYDENITFVERYLLGETFRDSDFFTKVQVILINVFTPLIIILVSFLVGYAYLYELKPFYLLVIDATFLSSILVAYLYFKISNDSVFFGHVTSVLQLLYFPFLFYSGGVDSSASLWMFLVPMTMLFVNEGKIGIAYTMVFNLFLLIITLFFLNDLLEVYTGSFLVHFFLSFEFYSLVLMSFILVNSKLNNINLLQTVELEEKNGALSKAVLLQKKVFVQLSHKDKNEQVTNRNLKAIINNTDDLIWLVDSDYSIKLFNNAFSQMIEREFGFDPEGKDVFKELLENHRTSLVEEWDTRYKEVMRSGEKRSFIDKEVIGDGSSRYLITDFYPIQSDGETVGVTCFSRDVTAQRKAKREKEELARLNTTIIASLGEIVYDYDVKRDEFTWNDAIYQVLGYNYTLMGKKLEQFYTKVHLDDVEFLIQEIEDLKETGFNTPLDIRVFTKNSGYIWMQNRVNVLYDDEGEPSRLIGVLFNINDRKEAEINQLQAVVKGVDFERKRIAAEIHDGLGQTLIAASLILSSLDGELKDKRTEGEEEQFRTVTQLINDAIDEGREISHSIMPKSLEDYGLIPSLKSLVNKVHLSKKLSLDFHCNVKDDVRYPIEVENNLYRVTQEALNNIIKHSEAGNVVLQLVAHKQSIILTIEDDGKGFVKLEKEDESGLGLQNIKNRISSIGGTLQIDTHEGYGTLITIEVEIKK